MSISRFASQGFAPFLLIALVGGLLFIPFLGGVHLFDWDEINFAEAAREMLVTGNYARVQIDFQPFWEKPPLFFWMQVVAMKLFGVNEFAARFPNAICGIFTFSLLFYLGRKYFNAAFGWLWILVYAGSLLPHFYFKSGIIDPWFNLFIFCGIVCLIEASQGNASLKHYTLAGISIGLAILTKGPVALLVTFLTVVVFLAIANRTWLFLKSIVAFFVSLLLVSSIWFAIDFFQNGTFFLREFIHYQIALFRTGVAGHSGPFYYHSLVLLAGCFPASIFALSGFFNKYDADDKQQNVRLWMLILFTVVLVLFSIVKTKIVHYSSLCYLPLTFLAAWEIHHRLKLGLRFSKWQIALLAVIGVFVAIATTSIPYVGKDPSVILPYIKDVFARANLEAQVDWRTRHMIFGFIYWILALGSIFWLWQGLTKKGTLVLLISTCLLTQVAVYIFVPRIERYSQGAAIDFYKTLQGKDVYVDVLGFKSYAHLYYSDKQPPSNPSSYNEEWLLTGVLDKPAYFVCKIQKADEYKDYQGMQEIGRKNGFVFLKRESNR